MAKPFPKLKTKLVLAPMHDATNLAFRLMCKKYGAGLVSTELLSANAIAKNNKAVLNLTLTDHSEKPVAAQVFSQNTENIVTSAKILEKKFDIIDINLGCPSKKIISQGAGGALLERKNKIAEIVKKTSESIKKPLTAKIRSGIDSKNINALEIAKICEENGASAITIHARTLEQGYSGKADWNLIKKIKQNVSIPVIGNGDVFTPQNALGMLNETNCDYVMIGRAAIANPFIFKQINYYLKNNEIINQSKEEKISDFFEYLDLCKKFNILSIKDTKLKAQEFTKSLNGSKRLRQKLNSSKDLEEIEKLMKEF
jgi:tRNA-dihydrouridine synthase B